MLRPVISGPNQKFRENSRGKSRSYFAPVDVSGCAIGLRWITGLKTSQRSRVLRSDLVSVGGCQISNSSTPGSGKPYISGSKQKGLPGQVTIVTCSATLMDWVAFCTKFTVAKTKLEVFSDTSKRNLQKSTQTVFAWHWQAITRSIRSLPTGRGRLQLGNMVRNAASEWFIPEGPAHLSRCSIPFLGSAAEDFETPEKGVDS